MTRSMYSSFMYVCTVGSCRCTCRHQDSRKGSSSPQAGVVYVCPGSQTGGSFVPTILVPPMGMSRTKATDRCASGKSDGSFYVGNKRKGRWDNYVLGATFRQSFVSQRYGRIGGMNQKSALHSPSLNETLWYDS
uniref:Uncharacterized protein n=1 Tax=Anopheles culicifacies TaxID=139723 RepID=A0A182LUE4_9DIPT